MLNPNLASKISYEGILNNFQNEAVKWCMLTKYIAAASWPMLLFFKSLKQLNVSTNLISSKFGLVWPMTN